MLTNILKVLTIRGLRHGGASFAPSSTLFLRQHPLDPCMSKSEAMMPNIFTAIAVDDQICLQVDFSPTFLMYSYVFLCMMQICLQVHVEVNKQKVAKPSRMDSKSINDRTDNSNHDNC